MPLCQLCHGLTITKLYPPYYYVHARNYHDALFSSSLTCEACHMIYYTLGFADERDYHPQLLFPGASDRIIGWGDAEERNNSAIKLQILPAVRQEKGFLHLGIWMKSKWMVKDLTLSVEEGDPLGIFPFFPGDENSFIRGRVLASTFPTRPYFNVAKYWLDACEAHHRKCKGDPATVQLPARVISVGSYNQTPYLMNGDGKFARYACLSHCWGRHKAIMTVKANLRAHQTAIPMQTLPKTFQDAIVVCREIGIPFLWIDSLCIIQDDKDDWEQQAALMGSIYHDSTLTIAATVSPDSSKGLFVPKTFEQYRPGIVQLPSSFGNYRGTVYLTGSNWGEPTTPGSLVNSGTLHTRGWVMQEKYLARRTLNFVEGQMVWVCCDRVIGQGGFDEATNTGSATEPSGFDLETFKKAMKGPYKFGKEDDLAGTQDGTSDTHNDEHGVIDSGRGPKDFDFATLNTDYRMGSSLEESFIKELMPPLGGRFSYIVDLRSPEHRTSSPPTKITRNIDNQLYNFLDVASRRTIYYRWYEVVRTYSDRELTVSSDKLPAVAGIAARVQAISQDQYLAGHWLRELERSLFWKAETRGRGASSRVKGYRAPSWSWASVDGYTAWDFADLSPGQDYASSIEVLEAKVEVDGKNAFGCVKEGKLVLKANIMKATWNAERAGWVLGGAVLDYNVGQAQPNGLDIFTADAASTGVAGKWYYDDIMNGIMPGPLLTSGISNDDIPQERRMPAEEDTYKSYTTTPAYEALMKIPLRERGTYLPETLILVKGPLRTGNARYQEYFARTKSSFQVLVLAEVEGKGQGVYRRVGVGELGSWDERVGRDEVLTIF